MGSAMKIPEEMRKKYLDRRVKDLAELSQALQGHDFEPFKRIGHQLKGNGPTFGYDELGELGKRMEESADAANEADLSNCLQTLTKWIAVQPK